MLTKKLLTFKGGIHPPHNKSLTQNLPINCIKQLEKVVIPLHQHIGAPCKPLVKKGDYVKKGQKIGEPVGFVGAPIHSSISGEIEAVVEYNSISGGAVLSVVINNDGKDISDDDFKSGSNIEELSQDEIKEIIKEAGIVGMGGAAFPTHVKVSPPKEKNMDMIIINGAECEPYITCDHRLMLENPNEIVYGIRAIMKAVGVGKAIIGIENNKPDAVERMKKAVSDIDSIQVVQLRTKYPQGGEKQLIYAVTGREVPTGGLPMDVGIIVSNVGTAIAVTNAIKTGMPLIERVITVTGSGIKEPQNLLVRIGTLLTDVVAQCGGISDKTAKLIMGGPMMGIAQYTLDVPVVKGTSGVLILEEDDVRCYEAQPCIKCARCVDACPVYLLPVKLANFSKKGMIDQTVEYNVMDCIECGSCSYICPSRIPLLDYIKLAKIKVLEKQKKNYSEV